MVSEWSADCATDDPMSCQNALESPGTPPKSADYNPEPPRSGPDYAWTDLTYLLHRNNVSWGYYVADGNEPDCEDDTAVSCVAVNQDAHTPGIWNPLPYFDTVRDDGELGNIQSVASF